MIVVNTSVFVAMGLSEPDADRLLRALAGASRRSISAGNYLECAIVAQRKLGGAADLDRWLLQRDIAVIPVDYATARIAADAYARFGRARHPAGLNYGDCFAYALASRLTPRCSSRAATSRKPTSGPRSP